MLDQLLCGLSVVDRSVGMPGALIAKFLRECGAQVRRAPVQGDPSCAYYPAYSAWRAGQELLAPEDVDSAIAEADILLLGGEDFPSVGRAGGGDALSLRHPRLIVLEILGSPPGEAGAEMRAVDILAQAHSGLVFELREGKPALSVFPAANYGAALQGLIGLGGALVERESSGHGQALRVSLVDGARTWLQSMWLEAERPTPQFLFETPKAAAPLILRCRDGVHIHLVMGGLGSKYRLYQVLGIEDPKVGPDDAGRPDPTAPPGKFYGDLELLQSFAGDRDSSELLPALWAAGQVAEAVLPPGACWDDPQTRQNEIIVRYPDGVSGVGNPAQCKLARPVAGAAGKLTARGGAPLAGLRVVDFGAFVAGPLASVALADLGADVIKVEPLEGDAIRSLEKFFRSVNRGKRAIAIDLKAPEGLEIAHRLCDAAEVVCSNFKVGAAARLGIDAATLHARRADVVVINNTGYGLTGPKAQTPAFDPAMQAVCGHEARAAGEAGAPFMNRAMMVDVTGGLLGSVMSLFALFNRARSGGGADVTVPLFNAGLFLLSELTKSATGVFEGAPPLMNDMAGLHPAEMLYATSDGWVAVAARDEAMASALVSAFELDEHICSPSVAWGLPEAELLQGRISGVSTIEALDRLRDAKVWATPCNAAGLRGALHDPGLTARGVVYASDEPGLGIVRGLGCLFSLSRTPAAASGAAPGKGRHTRVILEELGYSENRIDDLFARGVVR